MRKLGGFRFGCKLVRIWRYKKYLRFKFRARSDRSVTTKLINWGRSITRRLRGGGGGGDYYRLGDRMEGMDLVTPKGHLAVYVGGGRKEGGPPHRYLVPVIYFNHPLFGELLREAEGEFGFQHPGGITIPCPVAKFERVQTRIANSEPGRRSTRLK